MTGFAPRRSRRRRLLLAGVPIALLAAALAAAGSAVGGSKKPSALPDLAAVTAEVNKYKAIPAFVPPGPSFDSSKARGKTAFVIPVASTVPFVNGMDQGFQEAMRLAGAKVIDFPTQGSLTELQQGFQTAISRKVDLIMALAVNPATIGPQLAAAKRAGIPVVLGHENPPGLPAPKNITAQTLAPFYQAGKLEADYTIMDAKGKANALVIASLEQVAAPGMVATIKREFATKCGPGCKLRVVNVPVTQWATKIQSEVQSAIVNDSDLNYVIPLYDSMSQFAVPGIVAAGKVGKVKVVTFNGTPFVLKMIQDANVVIADMGENTRWLGWAIADQALRVLSGVPPIPSGEENTFLRVFDDSNVAQAGKPPVAGKGYGGGYITGYKKLWGLK